MSTPVGPLSPTTNVPQAPNNKNTDTPRPIVPTGHKGEAVRENMANDNAIKPQDKPKAPRMQLKNTGSYESQDA